ncbi:hypothetical protein HY733_00675 [Candidatus Uhrbacteria bacterium]|nr:hypothetical protein [Candidatus Uhrbacteria bacterium]
MNSTLAELRATAEPYKSFPKAVAAVVRAMFDHDAKRVEIVYGFWAKDYSVIEIVADRPVFVGSSIGDLIEKANMDRSFNWTLAFIHHGVNVAVDNDRYRISGLGEGEGVNPKQDRSAKRLVRELARHLAPRESLNTTVVDESGIMHKLVENFYSTVIGGYRISWPEKMIGHGHEGLILKFGSVRVSMGRFLGRLTMKELDRKLLNILTHPWLQGTVEIEVADVQFAKVPVPTNSMHNFDEVFYHDGHAATLGRALLGIMPGVALREMNKTVTADLGDFCKTDHELVLENHTYKLVCTDEFNLWRVEHVVLGVIGATHLWNQHEMLINVTHPVFRTIGPNRDEIMQILWWQLAIRIAMDPPEGFEEEKNINLSTTQIYLALRRQNPERWGD